MIPNKKFIVRFWDDTGQHDQHAEVRSIDELIDIYGLLDEDIHGFMIFKYEE